MEIHGQIKNGQIVMSPEMVAFRDNWAVRIKDGTAVKIKITRIGRNKTLQQLKCHWGLVVGLIRQEFRNRGMDLGALLNSPRIPEGIEVPPDVIQSILYACCSAVGDDGERKTLSRMDTIEASRFFESCRNYVATAWHIQIPDPDPNWKFKNDKPFERTQ